MWIFSKLSHIYIYNFTCMFFIAFYLKRFSFILCVWCFICVYSCVTYVCSVLRSQKKILQAFELELEMVVSCQWVSESGLGPLRRAASDLSCRVISPGPFHGVLKIKKLSYKLIYIYNYKSHINMLKIFNTSLFYCLEN